VSDKRSGIEKAASTIVMAYVGFPSLSQHERVMAMISDHVQPEMDELSQKIQQLELENAALRDARRVAEQVCTEAFAKVFAEYAARTLAKDTQP